MNSSESEILDLVNRAKRAQEEFEINGSQKRYDDAAKAVAVAILTPENNEKLAQLSVERTGLGNVRDKITKNHRKTLGLMSDLKGAVTFGVVSDQSDKGIVEIARPKGVIASIVPSTNPAATPANNIINALKCGNAIIVSPSPKGAEIAEMLCDFIYEEFDKIGENKDLVQIVPKPINMAKTEWLFTHSDFSIVTGAQVNVRRAYSSGMPVIGVGTGNVSTIIDETATLDMAAELICASKSFDNGTSCSAESNIIAVDAIYDQFKEQMVNKGALILSGEDADIIINNLWKDGELNPSLIAKSCDYILEKCGLFDKVNQNHKIIVLEMPQFDELPRQMKEKLSIVATLTRVNSISDAIKYTKRIYEMQGAGHSVGIHTQSDFNIRQCAQAIKTCRVIVNQAHGFATGGAFNNGLPFSLSMGCGTWGKNSIDDNLNYTHFLQRTKISVPLSHYEEPTLDDVLKDILP